MYDQTQQSDEPGKRDWNLATIDGRETVVKVLMATAPGRVLVRDLADLNTYILAIDDIDM